MNDKKLQFALKWGDPDRRLAKLASERAKTGPSIRSISLFALVFAVAFGAAVVVLA